MHTTYNDLINTTSFFKEWSGQTHVDYYRDIRIETTNNKLQLAHTGEIVPLNIVALTQLKKYNEKEFLEIMRQGVEFEKKPFNIQVKMNKTNKKAKITSANMTTGEVEKYDLTKENLMTIALESNNKFLKTATNKLYQLIQD